MCFLVSLLLVHHEEKKKGTSRSRKKAARVPKEEKEGVQTKKKVQKKKKVLQTKSRPQAHHRVSPIATSPDESHQQRMDAVIQTPRKRPATVAATATVHPPVAKRRLHTPPGVPVPATAVETQLPTTQGLNTGTAAAAIAPVVAPPTVPAAAATTAVLDDFDLVLETSPPPPPLDEKTIQFDNGEYLTQYTGE